MDWMEQFDGYCERIDFTFWAEPINAVTNLAFVIAAVIMAWRMRWQSAPLAWVLIINLALIGVGSFLFHTYATAWASAADVLPILTYILIYVFVANLHYFELQWWAAAIGAALYIPFSSLVVPVFDALGVLGYSAAYMPVPILLLAYAFLLRNRLPHVARGLVIGAGILLLSLTFRTIDEPLCHAVPHGTHFLWHILNAVMLGWMIEVYRRDRLAHKGQLG
ncbi:ceramidase domain-containing protein [Algirhabdus cladophorae]|uniref:ceramidase domain-containing protein n=1 Tax=Algirhabdus cladophorae TaxID=3377108 RepID=UPI003B84A5B7